MVVDNYGNLIEEPFHRKGWAIEWRWSNNGSWRHFRSYNKPQDVQKALVDLRNGIWNEKFDMKFRPAKRTYRKIESGFHAEHLEDATSNVWWNDTDRPLRYLKAVEEGRITKL